MNIFNNMHACARVYIYTVLILHVILYDITCINTY